MKFSNFLKTNISLFKNGIRRFACVFWMSIAIFAIFTFQIIAETDGDTIISKLYLSLFFGIISSFTATVFSEAKQLKKPQLTGIFSGIVCMAICFVLVHFFFDYTAYITMVYIGICLAMLLICLKLLVRGDYKDEVLPSILRRLFFAGEIGVVLSIGVSVCIAAFSALVFDFDDIYKVYFILNAFIWIVIAFNLFIAGIPDENTVYGESKFFKAIVLYAAFPVYMLLLAILYIYFIKIIVTLNLPSGEINWFSSFASLFFVFFVFCLRPYKTKITDLFVRFGGILMLPVSVMQFTALFIRINAYGFTVSRIVSLILATIALAFAVGFVFFRKKPETVFVFSAMLILLFTIIPKINLVDASITSQTNRIEKTLIKNSMLENGKIVPKTDISDNDKETIISAFQYAKGFDLELPGVLKTVSGLNFEETFGFESTFRISDDTKNWYYHSAPKDAIDIRDYSYIINFNSDPLDLVAFSAGGTSYEFYEYDILKYYYETYGNTDNAEPYMITDNVCIYPLSISVHAYENGDIHNGSIRGYALIK